MSEPWTLQGVSRATWYRRRRHREETVGETETASQAPASGETAQTETEIETAEVRETAEAETEVRAAAGTMPETVGTDIAGGTAETAPAASETLTVQSPEVAKEGEPGVLSDADLARHAARYQTARREKGEAIATRALKWQLQDTGTPYQFLQREVDRVRELATQISQ